MLKDKIDCEGINQTKEVFKVNIFDDVTVYIKSIMAIVIRNERMNESKLID